LFFFFKLRAALKNSIKAFFALCNVNDATKEKSVTNIMILCVADAPRSVVLGVGSGGIFPAGAHAAAAEHLRTTAEWQDFKGRKEIFLQVII
jgi:hypothetical protein